jgi:hypothetical protein
MRADVTIPGSAKPLSVLVKATSETETPVWAPRLDPKYLTEFYATDRRRCTDRYMCYVGAFDGAADESDVNPMVFDEFHSSGPYDQLGGQRRTAEVLAELLADFETAPLD